MYGEYTEALSTLKERLDNQAITMYQNSFSGSNQFVYYFASELPECLCNSQALKKLFDFILFLAFILTMPRNNSITFMI